MGEGGQWAGSGWGVGLYGGEGGGGSFHGGAGPVVDAAAGDAGVVGDGGAPSVGCVLLEAPCDPHDSPDGAHCGVVAQDQGEPWGQVHQRSQSRPERGHTGQDQGALYRD